MKTYRCKVSGIPVVVKVYVKRDPEEVSVLICRSDAVWYTLNFMCYVRLQDLRVYEEKMAVIRRRLSPHTKYPNVLPYQRWLLSPRPFVRGSGVPSFLIRQHFLSNLYDRISTRPFLSPVEKKWMTYQLLRALEQLQRYVYADWTTQHLDAHRPHPCGFPQVQLGASTPDDWYGLCWCFSAGVCHGDIKTENVMVTSWNWVVLTDLAACFKPHVLPDDDPADFHYFFDSSGRRRCYLAPERLG
jgi:phosphoinositide-3-kinase regulatory subunit 4